MCEDCEEAPVQFVAYFNKAGGKLWRPPHRVASTPSPIDGASGTPSADSKAEPKLNSKSAFVCEETRSE